MKKHSTRKLLSLLLALAMLLSPIPATALATGAGQVYISVSYDDQYITDKNGGYIAYVPVSFDTLAGIDLNEYGLSEYLYDEDGDGTYEITALHVIIYAHENLYGGDWADVTFTGSPGSSYFAGGLFGRDENLNYYLNGQYPLASGGWGATSDQIVLKAGDFIDLAGFTSWDFYQDSAYGFHFLADATGEITHNYTVEEGAACDVKLIKGTKDYEYNSVFFDIPGYTVHYGTALYEETGTVTTDGDACASITFPSAGIWYLWADGGYGNEYPDSIVSAPGYAMVTVTAKEEEKLPDEPRQPQDVSAVLNATMAKLASTVTAPAFGTNAGEWTVLSLARGGYFEQDDTYFADYYDRIVKTVNTEAASVNMNGALHQNKSTENSRLIVALSSIGKNATSVGDWDLVEAYSENGFDWIRKQGMNGTIWALIALDSNNYTTADTTIRQQCVNAIVAAQHDDGGWALQANAVYDSDPDVTGMALTALYPYRDQPAVAAACEEAFASLSAMQHDNGMFASGGSECSESCAWVIVAATTWGIDPDTDSRFIKNGNSVVDALLSHYLEDEAQFEHIIGAGFNDMATDQACYALAAYDRFQNDENALYDMSDVIFDSGDGKDDEEDTEDSESATDTISAALSLPNSIKGEAGTSFNGVLSVSGWDNEAGYKLIDFIVNVPDGLEVTGVTAGSRLSGGAVNHHLESSTGKLRVVYFDANENNSLAVSGTQFPAELFTIGFRLKKDMSGSLPVSVTGMSLKKSSDSSAEEDMLVVDTAKASGKVKVTTEVTYSAVCLYEGDDIDLIPSTKKAVAVAVTDDITNLTYFDGTNTVSFRYNRETTVATGVPSFIALVDKNMDMEEFANADNYSTTGTAESITFGDANGDGLVNAQDALAAVNVWLRKDAAPEGDQILKLNVNGDSRINTFDALGIVEHFVHGGTFGVVTKAAILGTNS